MDKKALKKKIKEATGDGAMLMQVAKACGVSYPTAHNWFSGKTKMPIDAVLPIQKAFGLSDDEVINIIIKG